MLRNNPKTLINLNKVRIKSLLSRHFKVDSSQIMMTVEKPKECKWIASFHYDINFTVICLTTEMSYSALRYRFIIGWMFYVYYNTLSRT